MSNPQPASASYGGSPQTYIPTAQPAGDVSYQNLLGFGSGAGGGLGAAASQIPGVNPAYQAYQQATGLYPSAAGNASNYLINSPYASSAILGAQEGQNYFGGSVAPTLGSAPASLAGNAGILLNSVDPNVTGQELNLASATTGLAPQYWAAGQPLQGVSAQLLNTGFDPQTALYNQLSGQNRDAANVANAGAGIGGTPYGASVAANSQNNFNINWQAQQLARQTQASQAANQVQQGIGSLLGQQSNLYGQGGALLNQAANTYGAGLGQAGAGFTNAGNVGMGLATGLAQAGALPYTAGTTIGNNALSGVNSLQSLLQGQANIGGQSFALPQQVFNDLQSYLQLGQAAQQQGLAGGQQGFNQLAGGIGGGIGAANTFLNPSSGIFPNALSGIGSGIGGLFGSTGGLSAADAAAFLPGGTTAGLSAADLATFLPAFAP